MLSIATPRVNLDLSRTCYSYSLEQIGFVYEWSLTNDKLVISLIQILTISNVWHEFSTFFFLVLHRLLHSRLMVRRFCYISLGLGLALTPLS